MSLCRFYMLLFFVWFLSIYAGAQENNSKPSVKVRGEVAKQLTLGAEDLAKMKRIHVNMKDKQGKDHDYAGVMLQEILKLAGVTMGNELRGENLTKYLMAKCADGYQVVFSLAELDSNFTNRKVILADESDGKALPAGLGPFRLIVPDDKKAARSSLQLTELVIRFAKE